METRAVNVLENYDLEVLRTWKGRGAFLCETDKGLMILKEYTGPAARLEVQQMLLQTIRQGGYGAVELLMRNKEGELISRDQDRTPYIVKSYFEGRECNLKDMRECQLAARCMGRLHNAMCLPEEACDWNVPVYSMCGEYGKHNRELKKVRRFLREKGQKTEFEICLLHYYDFFYEKALQVLRELEENADIYEEGEIRRKGYFCHGDFQHHNLLYTGGSFAVVNFEKYLADNPVRDLYLFLRKLLEKNGWSVAMGKAILTSYQEERRLDRKDMMQLYYRFSYPEKFWKIVNFYYNNGKAWIPDRNREKLVNLLKQDEEKTRFLADYRQRID